MKADIARHGGGASPVLSPPAGKPADPGRAALGHGQVREVGAAIADEQQRVFAQPSK